MNYCESKCKIWKLKHERSRISMKCFIRSIASWDPCTKHFPYALMRHIQLLIIQHPNEDFQFYMTKESTVKLLSDWSPILTYLLHPDNVIWDGCVYDLLEDIFDKAIGVHAQYDDPFVEYKPTEQQLKAYGGTCKTNDCLRTGSCYPTPLIRVRPNYKDENMAKQKDPQDTRGCGKTFREAKKQTGGLNILRCGEHGCCIGFHVIPQSESQNDCFSAILCHFPTPPEMIIMDFGCNLHVYAMKREHRFFKKTRFYVDQSHFPTHKKCGPSYNFTICSQTSSKYTNVNDQTCEQRNKILNTIKKQLGFANLDYFMLCLRVLIEMDNIRIMNNLYKNEEKLKEQT